MYGNFNNYNPNFTGNMNNMNNMSNMSNASNPDMEPPKKERLRIQLTTEERYYKYLKNIKYLEDTSVAYFK
jgi:hypothetical protein